MDLAQPQTGSLRERIDGPAGFALGLALHGDELQRVAARIEQQWLDRLRQVAPGDADDFAAAGIARYHELADRIDHGSMWPKAARILPAEAVAEIRRTRLADRLREAFGDFTVSAEEGLEAEEMYWRLVRPGQASDVGPLHADRWFWDLGHGVTPPGATRVKVWIAVVCDRGRSGLSVVPGSHLRQWQYHGQQRDGFVKPQIDEDEAALNPQLVPMHPGDAIVFHDALLHRGAVNQGDHTRVSVEFTMFVRS